MMYILAFIMWLLLTVVYGVINVIGFIFILIWKFKINTCVLNYKEFARSMDVQYYKKELIDKERMLYNTTIIFPPCPFTHLKWMMRYVKTDDDDVTDLLED